MGGYIYGVCGHGELRCLKAEAGKRVWERLAATSESGQFKGGARFEQGSPLSVTLEQDLQIQTALLRASEML